MLTAGGIALAIVVAGVAEYWAQNKLKEVSELVLPTLQNLNGSVDALTAAPVLALPPSALMPGGLNNGVDLPGLTLLAAMGITLAFARSKGGKIVFNNPSPNKGQKAAIDQLAKELGSGVKPGWIEYLITLMGAAGIPLTQAMDIVRCLNARGWMQPTTTGAPWDPDYTKAWNIITDQLQPDDIQAAWDDMRDIPVIDSTGKVWPSHLTKVSNGIRRLEEMLNNGKLSKGFKDALRKLIQWTDNKVFGTDNPLTWTDQGRSDFWLDVAKNAGCLQKITGKTNWP